MEREIIAQYEIDLGYEFTYEEVFNTEGEIHDNLQRIAIKVGYDMGLQKCSGGSRYDSMLVHVFYIRLLINNIISIHICLSKQFWFSMFQKPKVLRWVHTTAQ